MPHLENLVDEYINSKHVCYCVDAIETFVGISLESAISLATLSVFDGRKNSHQYRLPKGVLLEAERRLLDVINDIKNCDKFEDLHYLLLGAFGKTKSGGENLWGAGPLYAYDVAHRIGHTMGIEPVFVYLHAGALKGARKLGIPGRKVLLSKFPLAMHRLTPSQAEDFLCIYKDRFRPSGS